MAFWPTPILPLTGTQRAFVISGREVKMEGLHSHLRVRFCSGGRRLFGLEADGRVDVNIELLVSWREIGGSLALSQRNFVLAIW